MATRGTFGGQAPSYQIPSELGTIGQQLEVTSTGLGWTNAAPYPGYGLPDPIGAVGQRLVVAPGGTTTEWQTSVQVPSLGTAGQKLTVAAGGLSAEWQTTTPAPPESVTGSFLDFKETAGAGVFAGAPFTAQKIHLTDGTSLVRLSVTQAGTTTPLSLPTAAPLIAILPAEFVADAGAQVGGLAAVLTATGTHVATVQINGNEIIVAPLSIPGAGAATIEDFMVFYKAAA